MKRFSRRRKQYARKYDHKGHRWWLIQQRITAELAYRISRKLDEAILYGIENTGHKVGTDTYELRVPIPDDVLRAILWGKDASDRQETAA